MFIANPTRKCVLSRLASLTILSGLITNHNKLKEIRFACIPITTFGLIFILALLLKKPLSTERVLRSSYRIVVAPIYVNLSSILNHLQGTTTLRLPASGSGLLDLMILQNFILHIDLTTNWDWNDNYLQKHMVYTSVLNQEPIEPELITSYPIINFTVLQS